jgi:putative membrane protein insertion efficiency factor
MPIAHLPQIFSTCNIALLELDFIKGERTMSNEKQELKPLDDKDCRIPCPEHEKGKQQSTDCKPKDKPGILAIIWLLPTFLYRKLISPLLPPSCRYHPSCSRYMIDAVTHHGIIKGTILGTCRILRCNGLYSGGYDPIPEIFSLRQIGNTRRSFSIHLQKKSVKAQAAKKGSDCIE